MSNRIKKVLGFLLSLIVVLYFIIPFVKGNYQASKLFSHNPIEKAIKSVVLRDYPEWRPIQNELEKIIPESYANVSVSTVYDPKSKYTDLEISITTEAKLSDTKTNEIQNTVCNILTGKESKYFHIKVSAGDLKINSTNKTSFTVDCKK